MGFPGHLGNRHMGVEWGSVLFLLMLRETGVKRCPREYPLLAKGGKKMLKGLSENSPSSFLSPIPVVAPAKPARPCQHGSLLYFPGFFPLTPWLAMWLNDTFSYPLTCLHGSKSDLHRLLQLRPASHYPDNTLFQTFTF